VWCLVKHKDNFAFTFSDLNLLYTINVKLSKLFPVHDYHIEKD